MVTGILGWVDPLALGVAIGNLGVAPEVARRTAELGVGVGLVVRAVAGIGERWAGRPGPKSGTGIRPRISRGAGGAAALPMITATPDAASRASTAVVIVARRGRLAITLIRRVRSRIGAPRRSWGIRTGEGACARCPREHRHRER